MEPNFELSRQAENASLTIRGYLEGEGDVLVVLCHGLMLHCQVNPIKDFAKGLNDSGFATLRFDFLGTGISDGRLIDMTPHTEMEDLKAVLRRCQAMGYSKVIVAGHSLGGVVASMAAGQSPELFDGLILLAPAGVIESDGRSGKAAYVEFDVNNVPESITLWDQQIGRCYLLDCKDLKLYETASLYNGRTLVIHGDEDALVPVEYAERFGEVLSDCRLHILPKGDHYFIRTKKQSLELMCDFLREFQQ